MTIIDWLVSYCDTWNTTYSIFDCESSDVVYESDCWEDIRDSKYADCEILGFDMEVVFDEVTSDEKIHVEFNV